MMRCIKLISTSLLLLFVGWGVSSWYLSKQADQALDSFLATWNKSAYQYVAGVEVLEVDHGLLSSRTMVQITPNIPVLFERLGDFNVNIHQRTGPFFFSNEGLDIGLYEWHITQAQDASVDGMRALPIAFNVMSDFSNILTVSGKVLTLNTLSWSFNHVAFDGELNLASRDNHVDLMISELELALLGEVIALPTVHVAFESTSRGVSEDATDFISIDVNTENIPLNLRANASFWKNNATLDADLNVLLADAVPLKNDEAYFSLQLRDWLLSGLTVYMGELIKSSESLRQAQWALEEVETPEQQDFYHSLAYQAAQVDRLTWFDIVAPMLKAEQSQLAIKAAINQSSKQAAKLNVFGSAELFAKKTSLSLAGDIEISRHPLDESFTRLFQRWTEKGLLSASETTFESDVVLRGQKLLMNNSQVSLVDLQDELKKALIDQ